LILLVLGFFLYAPNPTLARQRANVTLSQFSCSINRKKMQTGFLFGVLQHTTHQRASAPITFIFRVVVVFRLHCRKILRWSGSNLVLKRHLFGAGELCRPGFDGQFFSSDQYHAQVRGRSRLGARLLSAATRTVELEPTLRFSLKEIFDSQTLKVVCFILLRLQ
jgi:hypothetical protein